MLVAGKEKILQRKNKYIGGLVHDYRGGKPTMHKNNKIEISIKKNDNTMTLKLYK